MEEKAIKYLAVDHGVIKDHYALYDSLEEAKEDPTFLYDHLYEIEIRREIRGKI